MEDQLWPNRFISTKGKLESYISNASGDFFRLKNNKTYFLNKNSTCWTCSLEHFQLYRLYNEVKKKKRTAFKKSLIFLSISFLRVLVKVANINKSIYYDHDLTSTNLHNQFCTMDTDKEIKNIVLHMSAQHKNHSVIVRCLNDIYYKELMKKLQTNKFQFIKERTVCYFDPEKELTRSQKKNLRMDLNLFKKGGYSFLINPKLKNEDINRIHELYTYIYLEKYKTFNPKYTRKFFEAILKDESYGIYILKKDQIDAFAIYKKQGNFMQFPCLGYDPEVKSLYRQILYHIISLSRQSSNLLNLSSGVTEFKRLRGGIVVSEYYAVYTKNLSTRRRIGWYLYRIVINKLQEII